MTTDDLLEQWRARVEQALEAALPAAAQSPQRLHQAMRHSVLGGGKRLRPLLVYAAGRCTGADIARLDAPAAAVELVHAYSLVHDDLPAMDDDALRRGQPTTHIAFDEASAILAGDALQALAFELLAHADVDPGIAVGWLRSLSAAAGAAGMCGGQALDIAATGTGQDQAGLERMHGLKTGALIRSAVHMGALAGSDDAATLDGLDRFAELLGLAFQVRDDILDIEADSATLGKTAGKDQAQDKSTYPALLGLDGARQYLVQLETQMLHCLQAHGDNADALRALARLAVHRRH
ncbi:polyprenyl synthetase family protein [Stenotrophomonas sp. W1S232]|jgi:Geranylgeranyl pyrophosphate synthase|uniref:Polyprenyl synthetase family protein n=1 Tax=Stenotrophomonas koreensis TaxID=266128 RepID=A0A7W3V015_9GAMM|nr:farnesyl diphosphate synthase [Stenotrophomonas koreensis]MBB1116906.1 polyprenyl synthetase family protein [Stenotrophomonas koreensis]